MVAIVLLSVRVGDACSAILNSGTAEKFSPGFPFSIKKYVIINNNEYYDMIIILIYSFSMFIGVSRAKFLGYLRLPN